MKVHILQLSWGEYDDADYFIVGVFQDLDTVNKVKEDILEKADRKWWPWVALNKEDHTLSSYELELNELTVPLQPKIPVK